LAGLATSFETVENTMKAEKTQKGASSRRVIVRSAEGRSRVIPGVAQPTQASFRTAAKDFSDSARSLAQSKKNKG
jgi:hypothetical protein